MSTPEEIDQAAEAIWTQDRPAKLGYPSGEMRARFHFRSGFRAGVAWLQARSQVESVTAEAGGQTKWEPCYVDHEGVALIPVRCRYPRCDAVVLCYLDEQRGCPQCGNLVTSPKKLG